MRYFCEMLASVPSARKSSSALFRSGSSPLSLRAAKPCSLGSSPAFPAILTGLVAGLCEVCVDGDAVVDDDVHPALVEQLDGLGEPLDRLDPAPALRATSDQLLVAFSAATLPLRSAKVLIELSSARVTMTPSPTE